MGQGCGLTLLLSPGHLDYVQGELRCGGGFHELLQVLSEELEHQVEFLLSMDHIQQSGREGSDSGHGSQDPNPPTSFPSLLDDIGVLQFFEQGDLSDGSAGNPLSLPVEKDGRPMGCFW